MDDDDPEKRIAELERSLAEHYPVTETPVQEAKADTSWVAPPPPPVAVPPVPPLPAQYGTGALGPAPGVYGLGSGGAGFNRWQGRRPLRSLRFVWFIVAFWVIAIPVGFAVSGLMSHFSGMNPFSSTPLTVSNGRSLSAGGNNKTQSITCNDGGSLTLSGNNNTFTVTGQCQSVAVSGNNARATVDKADTITVSGNNTHVTVNSVNTINAGGVNTVTIYHSGEPKTTKSGINVSVSRG